jgi:hypothetical protein
MKKPSYLRQKIPVDGLIETALARLKRQKQYARPLSRGGRRAEGLLAWLDHAATCIETLAEPEFTLLPTRVSATSDTVTIEGQVTLEGVDLADAIHRGGSITAYVVTLGFSQAQAFDWLGGDYGAQHVQSDLSNQALFALGRHTHARHKDRAPGERLRRIPIQAAAHCGQTRHWDPAKVMALMDVFGEHNPGVSVTAAGCFQPLNSILGLTIQG